MAPPDENLIALVATMVSFAIIAPLLIKWWPRRKPARRRKPGAATAKAPARPAERPAGAAAGRAEKPVRRPLGAAGRRAPGAVAGPAGAGPATRTAAVRGARAAGR